MITQYNIVSLTGGECYVIILLYSGYSSRCSKHIHYIFTRTTHLSLCCMLLLLLSAHQMTYLITKPFLYRAVGIWLSYYYTRLRFAKKAWFGSTESLEMGLVRRVK